MLDASRDSATLAQLPQQLSSLGARYAVRIQAQPLGPTQLQCMLFASPSSSSSSRDGSQSTTGQLDAATQALQRLFAKKVTQSVHIPKACRPSLLGAKGAALTALEQRYAVSIQLPKQNQGADEGDDKAMTLVTGDETSVEAAIAYIEAFIDAKVLFLFDSTESN